MRTAGTATADPAVGVADQPHFSIVFVTAIAFFAAVKTVKSDKVFPDLI